MQTDQSTRIFIPWVLITTFALSLGDTVGARAGESLGFSLGHAVEKIIQGVWSALPLGYVSSMMAGFINGLVAGMLIGFLQWLILRRWVKNAGWWILLTMFGSAIASFIGSGFFNFFVNYLRGTSFAFLVGLSFAGLIRGLFIGLPQWVLFARKFEGSFWWIVVSLFGWIIGDVVFAVGASAAMSLGTFTILVEAFLGAVSGILIGVITGFALVSLLNHPNPEPAS